MDRDNPSVCTVLSWACTLVVQESVKFLSFGRVMLQAFVAHTTKHPLYAGTPFVP
jgi:hypothetical protein